MSKRQFLVLLGVWIMIFLFLGLPVLWHKVIAVISGILVIVMAYNIKTKIEQPVDKIEP